MKEGVSVTAVGPTAKPILLCLAQQGRLDHWAARLEELQTFILLQAVELSAAVEMVHRCRPDLIVTDEAGLQSFPADFNERFLGSLIVRLPLVLVQTQESTTRIQRSTAPDVETVLPLDLNVEMTAIRVRAVLRRKRPTALIAHLRWGPLELRHDERAVLINGQPVRTSAHDFNFLALLLEAPDRVWTREELQEAVWGPEMQITIQAINVVAQRLRRCLTPALGYEPIKTVRGEGYTLGDLPD
jgi:two-component system phosphate regulon response regulator PhoB